MAELSLKQITDTLNAEFTGESRKIVFWYDENADFAEDVDSLELVGAELQKLTPYNQFYTKYMLERVNKEKSYLIYAPFAKPDVRENHLQDVLLYSREFYADKASLMGTELGIDKEFIEKYSKFFGSKERRNKLNDLEFDVSVRDNVIVALMSVICKLRTASFDEMMRIVLTENLEDNGFLDEFNKYGLLDEFWTQCDKQFGYMDAAPSLMKLLVSMFVTYTKRDLQSELPKSWEKFVTQKSGNVIVWLDNIKHNVIYKEHFDKLSCIVSTSLRVDAECNAHSVDAILDCDTFEAFDELILQWVIERLQCEDIGASLRGSNILEVCQLRMRKHFGKKRSLEYKMLSSVFNFISEVKYSCPTSFSEIVKQYRDCDYQVDRNYRAFYFHFDQLEDSTKYEGLRDSVENIYTNVYLNQLVPKWNQALVSEWQSDALPLQREFFKKFVKGSKDKVVVIISDALRYEVGVELYAKLQDDAKCKVKLDAMLGVLPSYTRLGMAALLPHKRLEMSADYKVLVDGNACDNLRQREAILKLAVPRSHCVQFDEVKSMKKVQLREVFTNVDVVYVYHNQIDARGDRLNTENEVFSSCAEAIEEIYSFVKRLSGSAGVYHCVVTSDHGFIYKRDKLVEGDKISGFDSSNAFVNRRFIVANEAVNEDGVASLRMGHILGNDDAKVASFPISSNVFKVAGGGQNFVHGGSSPQEMVIPVIDVKMERGQTETRNVSIAMVSMVNKVTNLITSLDFIQSEPVSDVVKATTYKMYFESEDGEKISNAFIYEADKRDAEPGNRIFRVRFNLKNREYDKGRKFYFVAVDENNGIEAIRHDVMMDLAFANDFGFNV